MLVKCQPLVGRHVLVGHKVYFYPLKHTANCQNNFFQLLFGRHSGLLFTLPVVVHMSLETFGILRVNTMNEFTL